MTLPSEGIGEVIVSYVVKSAKTPTVGSLVKTFPHEVESNFGWKVIEL